MPKKIYFVYILECADKSLYTGITTDVERRFKEHKAGIGSHYTRAHGAKKILHTEKFPTRSAALRREIAIKKLSRTAKVDLIKKSL